MGTRRAAGMISGVNVTEMHQSAPPLSGGFMAYVTISDRAFPRSKKKHSGEPKRYFSALA